VAVSQAEREAIGGRPATALGHKKANHRAYNHTPYGYERSGDELILMLAEQAVISRVKHEATNGLSLRRIADGLNCEGVATKQGATWFASTIRAILRNNLHETAA